MLDNLDTGRVHMKFAINLAAIIEAMWCDGEFSQNECLFLNTWLLNSCEKCFKGEIPDTCTEELITLTNQLLSTPDFSMTEDFMAEIESIYDALVDFINENAPNYFRYHEYCINSLQGTCTGIFADNEFDFAEVAHLVSKLSEYRNILIGDPVCSKFYSKIDTLIEEMTNDNADEYINKLCQLVKDFSESADDVSDGMALGKSFFDYVGDIDLQNKRVCFTGKFQYGSRSECETLAKKLGAMPARDVTYDTSYLIIGTFSARNWMYQTYGRKMEKALELQQRGVPIKVITEDQWLQNISLE